MKKTFFLILSVMTVTLSASAVTVYSIVNNSNITTVPENETSYSSKIVADKLPDDHHSENSFSEISKPSVNNKISVNDCDINVRDRVYCGKFTEPRLKVEYNGKKLVKDNDYCVVYDSTEDKGAGRYSLTVKMTGEYEGSIKKEYNILPAGISYYSVSSKVNSITFSWNDKKDGADGFEILYSTSSDMSNPESIIINGCNSREYTFGGLEQNTKLYIKIRTIKNTGLQNENDVLYSSWSNIISAETKKVEVIDGVTYIDGIIVVNKTYSLPESYGDGLQDCALEAFEKMAESASEDGLYLEIVSGFRSYYTQACVYENFCYERGQTNADRVSARPGHSEHQTGLAMDINSTSFAFSYTPEAKWLAENCYKYGFIIRYPEEKESITGYSYESWHLRYLGKELAGKLYKSGETLEEYLGITSVYDESGG